MSIAKDKLTYVEKKQVINANGEVIESEEVKQIYLGKEPDYVKLYIEDLGRLNRIPSWCTGVLYSLIKRMDYENKIVLNAHVKRTICEECQTPKQTLDNALGKLTRKGIFTRLGGGTYFADPYIFGRGDWKNIKQIRTTYTYNPKQGVTRQTEFEFGEAAKQQAS